MDVLITDSMLRVFLDTKVSAAKIAECVSLCGPSIEKVTTEESETIYHVEATTNRVDSASAFGLAREAAAILPKFEIDAKLIHPKTLPLHDKTPLDIHIQPHKPLCTRIMALKIENIVLGPSPSFMQSQLQAIGQRPINIVVDITNYVMFMLGVPMHAFDYDALTTKQIVTREAKKGEHFTTLDNKKHITNGGEIVFDDGTGTIIDLPGIMGVKETAVSNKTKTILLVSENLDPIKIREASLKLAIRTHAASINEKTPDPNAMPQAFGYAAQLFREYAKGTVTSELFDWYETPLKEKSLTVEKTAIDRILGITITKQEMTRSLTALGFKVSWKDDLLQVTVPTFRVADIEIEEDIAEEVARIYGYFRFPSPLMEGKLTGETKNPQFTFESKIKTCLSGWGGCEVYTLSLVSKQIAGEAALKLKNPIGGDGEYLRTSLTPVLYEAALSNKQEQNPFHLFEISNVYLPRKGDLPLEQSRLCGVFGNTDYRHAKGIVEALFEVLHITKIKPQLSKRGNYYLYEYTISELMEAHTPHAVYREIAQFPAQIEDLTLLVTDTKVGDIISHIKKASDLVSEVSLVAMYEQAYTFRVSYLHPHKTLTDREVKEVRETILKSLEKDLQVIQK